MLQKSRRHPSALYLLCLVEGGERFAASAILSLFALYLSQHRHFTDSASIMIVGGVLAGSYLANWPSGWLADRWLGASRSARLGALLLGLGYAALWTDAAAGLWVSLALLVVGQGLFRSAITTLVGQLYAADEAHREAGFGHFFMAVNLGYLAGPFCAEWMRARVGWHGVFGLAAAVLLLGLVLLVVGASSGQRTNVLVTSESRTLPPHIERSRVWALSVLSGVAVVFWSALHQTNTSLPLFVEHHTQHHWALLGFAGELAPGHFASLHGALALAFTPMLVKALAWLRVRNLAPSTPAQFAWGLVVIAAAFALMSAASLVGGDQGRVHLLWPVVCYALISLAEVLWGALGLALIARLAPPRLASRMAGLWYASMALGYLLAGGLGPLWQRWPHHRYFALLALLCLAAAALLLASLRRLKLVEQRDITPCAVSQITITTIPPSAIRH